MDKVCFNCPLSSRNKVKHLIQLFHLEKNDDIWCNSCGQRVYKIVKFKEEQFSMAVILKQEEGFEWVLM
jgi:hypothetical protein